MEESKGETKKLEHVVKLKDKKIEALESRYDFTPVFAQILLSNLRLVRLPFYLSLRFV